MKIIICDDQALIRDGLSLLLQLERDMQVVGVAVDGAQAVELVARERPDLVLMDLKMPIMNGIEATRQICSRFPETRVLVLTTFDDDEWVVDAIRAGAAGYLLKDTPREDIVKAVRGTVAGKTYVDPAVAGKLLQQMNQATVAGNANTASVLTERLTPRELEVLGWLGRGLSNADIAARLHLSEGTVRNHISMILSKLGLADRTQAAVLAVQHGLIKGSP